MKKKTMAVLLAVLLVAGIAIGGTMAWLTSTTDPVQNIFTAGDVDITLAETTTDYQMIPGWTIAKDPKVTVVADSEDCLLFVKIAESTTLDKYISYDVASDWTALDGQDGVYYREVKHDAKNNQVFDVIGYTKDGVFVKNTVLVNETVTKQDMEDLKKLGATQPTLTFTAYAIQLKQSNEKEFTAEEAWQKVSASA